MNKNLWFKKGLICIFMAAVFSICHAQLDADSLKQALLLSKKDTNRVKLLSQILMSYIQVSDDSVVKFGQEGVALARELGFRSGEADCLRRMGISHFTQGRFPEALELYQQAQKISEEIHHTFGIAAGLGHIGNVYAEQGNRAKANEVYHQYLALAQQIKNNFEIANAWRRLGDNYLEMGNLDSASYAYAQASQDAGDRMFLAVVLKGIGRIKVIKGDTLAAIKLFREAIRMSQLYENFNQLSESHSEMAEVQYIMGHNDSSIYYGKLGFETASKNNYAKGKAKASKILAAAYEKVDEREALKYHKLYSAINDTLFSKQKTLQVQNLFFLEQQRQQALEASKAEYRNRLRLYALLAAVLVFLLIAAILYRNNRAKQKANVLLNQQKDEIQQQRSNAERALAELKTTQTQLIQSEKMASLGELTAGIAHEIQNPLNFVNNFAEVNTELLQEMKSELEKGNLSVIKNIANDLIENEEKISQHGKRADSIVKGMLQHSRSSTGQREPTDTNALVDEYLRLSYHGFRAKEKNFNVTIQTDFDTTIGAVNIVPQDIGRVLLNLFNNAFYAVYEKQKSAPANYSPTLSVTTKKVNNKIEIKVSDNGKGIQDNIREKIFQPFFTTKPTGQGTGLGLSLSYDIVKAHGGEIKLSNGVGKETEFTVELPTIAT